MAGPNPELRERVERFSLLRASQRALARCVHPSALDPLRQQGRELLIRIQAFDADGEGSLGEIDRMLGDHLGGTLELLGKLEFAQLRAAGPELCRDKPEEMRALVDVMLLGKLAGDREVRLLEYVITMLCADDEDGRRTLAHEPHELTPGLRAITQRQAEDARFDARSAVTRLQEAAAGLMRGDDHGALRDEVRGFKQELGARMLHPRVLVAAVEYNIAMANQVSARIDSTLALDQLADDLLADLKQPEAGDSDLLHGSGMTRLEKALRARVQLASCDDDAAVRVAEAFRIDGLVPREVEALEDSSGNPLEQLIVSSVVLGCVLRQRTILAEGLAELELDPERLEKDALPALLREMGAASSKFFADSAYAEAFEMSEVKTRNLAAVSASAGRRAREAADADSEESQGGWQNLTPRSLAMALGSIVAVVLGFLVLMPTEREVQILTASELGEISPFLDSGHQRMEEGKPFFVGRLFPTWEYLGDPEREAAATEIGQFFDQRGVETLVLLGTGNRVMARWESGELTKLAPKPVD